MTKAGSPSPNEIIIQVGWAIHKGMNIRYVVVNAMEETKIGKGKKML